MLLYKQAEKGIQLQAEQSDWLADTDDEMMNKNNDIQDDQNDVECDDERVALANLITNLKLDVDENKKIQKQLKKANATLTQELTECKSILAETSRTLGESNIDYDKLKRKLNETLRLLAQKEIDIKEGLKVKAYEISIVKEKHDELVKQSLLTQSHYEGLVKEKTKVITDLKLKEEKDIDKMISMENQLKPTFANPRMSETTEDDTVCKERRQMYFVKERYILEYKICKAQLQDKNIAIRDLIKEISDQKVLTTLKVTIHLFSVGQSVMRIGDFLISTLTTFNLLSKKDVVIGLPKLKYVKDQLCSSCEVSKAKRSSFKSKTVPRYTWTLFLCSKDETLEVLKDFLTMIQRNLQASVISVRTDRGTEFLNKTLNAFFKEEGIEHPTSTPQTPEQNDVQLQPHAILKTDQSSSQLMRKWHITSLMIENPQLNTLHIFGCTCYLTRDGENFDKMKEKGIRAFWWDTPLSQRDIVPVPHTIGIRYDIPGNPHRTTKCFSLADTTVPSQQELDLLFGPLYDEFFNDDTFFVNKSSSPTDNSAPQDIHLSMNIHPTSKPSSPTNVHAEENNDN
ncbi:retrovirus-related pol polyprotein from transposon TNT 1-94 [Tanacetum coccineum]|uniref:Retrovirus-related pol polyprotein from transposon TNT 1-94 n=1 Tax=Tanacetum coccineum TaxID=301880 RepID=A0ABQ5D5Y4_9ASTR